MFWVKEVEKYMQKKKNTGKIKKLIFFFLFSIYCNCLLCFSFGSPPSSTTDASEMSKRSREDDDGKSDYIADKTNGTGTISNPGYTGIQTICDLPPCNTSKHPLVLKNATEYELHYLSAHTYVCSVCQKVFPNEHLLGIHIDECHGSFVSLKLERGEAALRCFDPLCDRMFLTHKKRRMHLVDKHDYPKDFLFSIVVHGITPGQYSLLKRGKFKPANETK